MLSTQFAQQTCTCGAKVSSSVSCDFEVPPTGQEYELQPVDAYILDTMPRKTEEEKNKRYVCVAHVYTLTHKAHFSYL